METTKFLRFNTPDGTQLISASVFPNFVLNKDIDNTYIRLLYLSGWNLFNYFKFYPKLLVESTSTSTVTNKIVDTNADFIAAGIQPGDIAYEFAQARAKVVSVDSATEITLSGDIITGVGKIYGIYSYEDSTVNQFESNLRNAMPTVLSKKYTEVVIDPEVPEGITSINIRE